MVDRADGVRQSNFTVQTSMVSGSSLGFFANGYNYQITYANFLNGLGVTGSIDQDGAVTGTPVLDIQGTVNYIRNLEEGPGVLLNVSSDNGIEIAHNFTVDAVGEPLIQNAGAASPTVVSLEGGTGIAVSTAGSRVVITSTQEESYGTVTMQGNATATVITATATPVLAAGTFTVGDVSGYSGSTAGRLAHTGESGRHIVNALVTLDVAAGSNHLLSVYIAKNGTVIAATKMSDTVSSGLPRSIATFTNLVLATNDYVEIFVRNESTTDDITVVNAVLSAL